MLNKKVFENEVNKIVIEFKDKGFEMTQGRSEQWYDYIKDMSDDEFNKRIDCVLRNCSYKPSMADVFKFYERIKCIPNAELYRYLRSIRSQIVDIYPESIEADKKIGNQLSVMELALLAVENKIKSYRRN